MSGLDEILDIISQQQKQTENNIIRRAEEKARAIEAEGNAEAEKAYEDYMKKASVQAETDYKNAYNSADAEMKRKILKCRVEIIDSAIENIISALDGLPESEYFEMILKIVGRKLHKGNGIIYFGENDLQRLPSDFAEKLTVLAEKEGGMVVISDKAAEINDGFVLEYGLISENCSFGAIIESEKDGIRDTLARELFSGR
ncbi:MAG: V-type ATP synthase subunit E [Ruminococcus sp.]|nr:V-type ATP synthase subunit E [Ruminococcus sp.]